MGIEFRGKEYKKDVKLGKRTVKDGEAVAIWNSNGQHRQVVGPRLVRLFFSTIRFLDRKTAGPKEYLRVVLTNGNVEHVRGPVTMYENPVLHTGIEVLQAITLLAASDCIVIHRMADAVSDKASPPTGVSRESIQRLVVHGPTTYFPGPRETLLKTSDFSRSPRSSSDRNEEFIFHTASRPWAVEFPMPKGILRLAFRFTLSDVEAMLDNTTDLMADLHEAVYADLTNIAAHMTNVMAIEEFNSFNHFPVLLRRGSAIGVAMDMVTIRGFEPSPEIKRAEDGIKQMNDKMTRDSMLAEQEERRIATEIAARQARLAMEHGLEEAVLAGKQARLTAEQEFLQRQQECDANLEKRRIEAHLEYHRLVNDESLRVLRGLKDLGADITKLLCEGEKKSALPNGSPAVGKGVLTGREAVIVTSPALQEWFSVPASASAGAGAEKK